MGYYKEPYYKTEEALQDKILEFKKTYHKDAERKPSKARLNVHLGICDVTRNAWKKEDHKFSKIMRECEDWIKAEIVDLGFEGNKHAEFQLARAFHMTEKQVIEQTNINTDMTDDEKAERVARLKGKKRK